ncbi:MAG: hypothetical protein ACXWOV_08605, partial [Isosphaeraceae bacterium]
DIDFKWSADAPSAAKIFVQDPTYDAFVGWSPDIYNVTDKLKGSRLVVTTNEPPCAHVWSLRAIRRQLAEMGLNWDAPAYAVEDVASPDLPPLPPLKVDYGPLAGHVEHFSERPEPLVERYSARIKQNPNDFDAYHHRAHALFQ